MSTFSVALVLVLCTIQVCLNTHATSATNYIQFGFFCFFSTWSWLYLGPILEFTPPCTAVVTFPLTPRRAVR